MKANTIVLGLAITSLFTACKSPRATPQIWPGASPEVRARLGTVGVQIDHARSRQFVFEVPETKSDAASGMSGLAVSGHIAGVGALAGDGAGAAAIFVLALVPVSAAGGAIYGSLTGVRRTELHDALNQMTNAVHGSDLLVHFPEHVLEQARAQHFRATDARKPGAVWHTKLNLRVMTQQLVRVNESPNSALQLHYVVEAQVLGAGDSLLYSTYASAISPRRKFIEWAAHDGETLRQDSERMMQEMAAKILSRVYRGEDSE
jgi:hypothetical protein